MSRLISTIGRRGDSAGQEYNTTRTLMSYIKAFAQNVPQIVAGTTDTSPLASMDLWTADGPVILHDIFGIVTTTAIQAQATTINLLFDPDDGGSDVALDAGTLDATGDVVGTVYRWTKDFSDALIASLDAGEVGAGALYAGTVVTSQAGDIKVTYGAASTGQINWFCVYSSINGSILEAA